MKAALRDELLRQVQRKRHPEAASFGSPVQVLVGQIRLVKDAGLTHDPMLVVVVHVDAESGTAQVVAVVSPPSLASSRDLVVESSMAGTAFPLVLLSDAVSTVWIDQLSGSQCVGQLQEPVALLVRRAHLLSQQQIAQEASDLGIAVGQVPLQQGDQLWWLQARLIARLAEIAGICTQALFGELISDDQIERAITLGSPDDLRAVALARRLAAAGRAPVPANAWNFLDGAADVSVSPDLARVLGGPMLESLLNVPPNPHRAGAVDSASDDEGVFR